MNTEEDEVDFLPSQVYLGVPPLVGTMRKSEIEGAAALVIATCAVNGDAWQAVTPKLIGELLRGALEAKTEPWASLNRNPFFRPDIRALAASEYGRWTSETEDPSPIELTKKGLFALSRWVRR